MLLPAEVRPFLLHEDSRVRERALDYLQEAHDPAPASQDDLWAVIDRFGDTPTRFEGPERRGLAVYLKQFPATEASAERLLRALRSDQDPVVRVNLIRAAAELPEGAVRRLLDDPAVARRLEAKEAAGLREVLELSQLGLAELWDALGACAEGLPDEGALSSPLYRRAQRIVRALARGHEQAGERALAILRAPAPTSSAGFWRETFALELFARVRLPGVEERILQIVADDEGDYANERAVDALVHLGTAAVVAAVEARFAGGTRAFRGYAPGILGRIKRPESEAALLRLLQREEDIEYRTPIATYLCDLCPTLPEALEAVARIVLAGDYDPMYVDLDEHLLTTGKMVGWSPPDPAAWEARPRATRPAMFEDLRRVVEGRSNAPFQSGKPRGFVPYGKKARKKKR